MHIYVNHIPAYLYIIILWCSLNYRYQDLSLSHIFHLSLLALYCDRLTGGRSWYSEQVLPCHAFFLFSKIRISGVLYCSVQILMSIYRIFILSEELPLNFL